MPPNHFLDLSLADRRAQEENECAHDAHRGTSIRNAFGQIVADQPEVGKMRKSLPLKANGVFGMDSQP